MSKTIYIITLILLWFSGVLNAQWIQTSGPYGGDLRALCIDSPFVYTGGDYAGIYKSSDNGFNWSRKTKGLMSLRIMSLIKVSGYLFAGMDVDGIYVSTNNGETWSQQTNGLPAPSNITVSCFASKGDTVYAGINQGVYMTTDFGLSWTAINNGILSPGVNSLLVDGSDMFAATESGVYYSNNDGNNWYIHNTGLNDNSIGNLAILDTILFAASLSNDTLFVSKDKGNHWFPIWSSGSYDWLTCVFVDKGKIYVGTSFNWLYVSQDTGLTWQQLKTGILHSQINKISKNGNNIIIATNGGIYQSVNDGLIWMKTDTNLAATRVYDLYMENSNLFSAAYNNGVCFSSNGGDTWNVPNASIGNILSQSVVVKDNNVFTGSGITGVLHSSDYGINWSPFNNGIPTNTNYFSLVSNSSGILAGGGNVYYSSDNGTSWSKTISGITDFSRNYLAADSNVVFNVTYNENIFRSTDYGMNWTQVYDGTSDVNPIWQVDVSDNYVVTCSQHGILISYDLGNTWSFANNGLTDLICIAVEVYGVNIWTSTNTGVYFSNDFGQNWSYCHLGLDTMQLFYSFELDSNYIYGGACAGGVWKRALSDFPLSTSKNFAQKTISIFPNPFSKETSVFVKGNLNNSTIKIYNTLGEEVREFKVYSERNITIARDGLKPGIYLLYLFQADEITKTAKLVVSD